MTDTSWQEHFADIERTHHHLSDLGSDIYEAENSGEPRHTLTLAGSAAAATEGLNAALNGDWSLYTPQEAAAAAAAVYATVQTSMENLRLLQGAVENMVSRNAIDLPDPENDEVLFDGTDRLGAAADEIEAHLDLLAPAIASLKAVPACMPAVSTVHDNMVAIASELGVQATLMAADAKDHLDEVTDTSCGCVITIPTGDDFFYLDYGWLDWTLVPNSAATREGGQQVWRGGDHIDLGVDPLAHPGHIAALVRRHIESPKESVS